MNPLNRMWMFLPQWCRQTPACRPDDVIYRWTDGRAANRATASPLFRLDLPIYRHCWGLIEATDGEGEQTAWRCDFLRTEHFPGQWLMAHFLLMAQLDFCSETQSVVGVMENIFIYERGALSEGSLSEETHQLIRGKTRSCGRDCPGSKWLHQDVETEE